MAHCTKISDRSSSQHGHTFPAYVINENNLTIILSVIRKHENWIFKYLCTVEQLI